ncbi:hypothetical protein E0E54_01780 [Azotobacter chroococcum]|uniref:hypothetical protein n=1 Tax=Azotobacter chroococcum TaxID=353 RepID=UPI00104054E2|nr:hypothetical protein [Azotobacter chroococcum]TBW39913.1 hypothetical protein E0E54_01780 [Azotobacter chroococcum]
MSEYDEKVRLAQVKIFTEYGLVVDLCDVNESVIDFVNDNFLPLVLEGQTFASWCDQVFGFHEFGVRVRPDVAQFASVGPQSRMRYIVGCAELAIAFREREEESRLEVKSLNLEVKKLKSRVQKLEKTIREFEGKEAEKIEVIKGEIVLNGECRLVNDLHMLREEHSKDWAPGLVCDLVELLSEIDDEESVESVSVLSNLMGRINKRIKSVEHRSLGTKGSVDFCVKGSVLSDTVKTPKFEMLPKAQEVAAAYLERYELFNQKHSELLRLFEGTSLVRDVEAIDSVVGEAVELNVQAGWLPDSGGGDFEQLDYFLTVIKQDYRGNLVKSKADIPDFLKSSFDDLDDGEFSSFMSELRDGCCNAYSEMRDLRENLDDCLGLKPFLEELLNLPADVSWLSESDLKDVELFFDNLSVLWSEYEESAKAMMHMANELGKYDYDPSLMEALLFD